MRIGIWALLALIIGALGTHFLLAERGYVLISFLGYRIEMSVPILALLLILFYLGVRLLLGIWHAPKQLGEAIAAQRTRRTGSRLTRGLIHMTEGDFRRGERLLTDGLQGSDAKVVHYLMAARAAEAQGSAERRDEWLALARESDTRAELAVLLTQAELQIRARDYPAALNTLAQIDARKPGHAGALALTAEACLATGDRRQLADILPRLAKAKLDPDRLAGLIRQGLNAMRAEPSFDRDQLKAIWSPLPAGVRQRPALVAARARLLERLGRGQDAVKTLAAALNRRWDRELVAAYGEVRGADPLKQLQRAEDWLKQHGEDAVLLTATARLCMVNELWGKARSYLESSLALAPEPATFALYGELLDSLGEHDGAARAYQSGLKMVAPAVETLPALAAPSADSA